MGLHALSFNLGYMRCPLNGVTCVVLFIGLHALSFILGYMRCPLTLVTCVVL